jgi:hypothetical protein
MLGEPVAARLRSRSLDIISKTAQDRPPALAAESPRRALTQIRARGPIPCWSVTIRVTQSGIRARSAGWRLSGSADAQPVPASERLCWMTTQVMRRIVQMTQAWLETTEGHAARDGAAAIASRRRCQRHVAFDRLRYLLHISETDIRYI